MARKKIAFNAYDFRLNEHERLLVYFILLGPKSPIELVPLIYKPLKFQKKLIVICPKCKYENSKRLSLKEKLEKVEKKLKQQQNKKKANIKKPDIKCLKCGRRLVDYKSGRVIWKGFSRSIPKYDGRHGSNLKKTYLSKLIEKKLIVKANYRDTLKYVLNYTGFFRAMDQILCRISAYSEFDCDGLGENQSIGENIIKTAFKQSEEFFWISVFDKKEDYLKGVAFEELVTSIALILGKTKWLDLKKSVFFKDLSNEEKINLKKLLLSCKGLYAHKKRQLETLEGLNLKKKLTPSN